MFSGPDVVALTSIAGLVHVNDLDLTTQILVSPCHTCPVYAINMFGFPRKIPNLDFLDGHSDKCPFAALGRVITQTG